MIPLTTEPNAVQAWKIVIPSNLSEPRVRSHEGIEWLFVLSGTLRLIVADEDRVLEVGTSVEFDTQVPHWFGSTGAGPVEVISIFNRPGERMHVAR